MALDVDVAELRADELPAAAELVVRIWGTPPERPLLPLHVLRAMALAGEQLLGAFLRGAPRGPDTLVGASIAFVGTHTGGHHLHSHITGVDPAHLGRGIGFALKQAQRAWALAHGIAEVRWTFDPLVARNAHFNLTKLGARGVRYHVDCYGALPDTTNAGDETDRVEAHWDLTRPVGAPEPEPDPVALRERGATVVLEVDEHDRPTVHPPGSASVLLARVPADIVALRARDPDLARVWRIAARDAIGGALGRGSTATGASRSGWWVLERASRPGEVSR